MSHPTPDGYGWAEIGPMVVMGIAGLAGSLVSLRWMPGSTLAEKLTNLGAGVAVAFFGGPYLQEWTGADGLRATLAVGFGAGLFGVAVADSVMAGWKSLKLGDMMSESFRSFFVRGNKPEEPK